MKKTGVLFVNVGTPDSPHPHDVRKYLLEFLWDKRVIDISSFARFLLLYFIILPFRTKKSAKAYESIWLAEGSPLLIHSRNLAREVENILAEKNGQEEYIVEYAMRYQNPPIEFAIEKLMRSSVDKIIVLPLFPQYSSATTGSIYEKVSQVIGKYWNIPEVVHIPPFYAHPKFMESFAAIMKPQLDQFKPDYVLFSYHGLPERHIRKSDVTGNFCLQQKNCCDDMNFKNRFCYRGQCFSTTRSLAQKLNLAENIYSTSFQSRLGTTKWIEPYTDIVLPKLAKKGIKRLAITCPAFVADCLETLEEIAIRAKAQWLKLGGEDLLLVPSLNSNEQWAQALAEIICEH